MVFPQDRREITVELFAGGGWRDISTDVYQRDPITIRRGRANESAGVDPATCTLTLDNRAGDYSPRNPLGAWYGELDRNTPLRIAVGRARDAFDRTTASGWGTADVGGAWTVVGTASDYATSAAGSGAATVLLSAANTVRTGYLGGQAYRDVDVAATVSIPDSDVTGGSLLAGIWLRRDSTGATGYLAYLTVTTAEAVQVQIYDFASAAFVVGATTVTGLTHSSGQTLRIRAQADGQTLRVKVWAASGPEPFAWHAEGHDDTTAAGFTGLYSATAAGSTDAPITFTWTDFVARSMRFHGEVASWPAATDVTGADAYVQVEAGGLRRRLAQGATTIQSSLRRSIPALPDLVAYWPMEDDRGATQLESGLADGSGAPMYRSGPVKFGENTDFVASRPIPVLNGGILFARPPAYTVTGETQVRAIVSVPSSGGTDNTALLWLLTSGTAPQWMLVYTTGTEGSLTLRAFDASGAVALLNDGPYNFALDGSPCRLGIELTQNGAHIDYSFTEFQESDGLAFRVSGTLNSRTVGRVLTVQVNLDGGNEQVAVGHVTIENNITSQFDQSEEITGYATGAEQAGERIQRLCTESALPFAYTGSLTETDMGPQPIAPLLDALDDAADANFGTLVESRSAHALVFRERSSLYNADPVAALTYTAGELAPPFEPVDDDRSTRNDVTFKRAYGSQARATQETGPLNVADPADGGVGRYQVTVTGNTQSDTTNPDGAGWALHLGTVDEPRFPRITIDLANPNVAGHVTLPVELLDLDVDERIAIDGTSGIGLYDGLALLVRGYTETLSAFTHRLALHCAPASPYDVPEVDAAEAKVDTEDSTLAAGVTSSATSLSVATTGAHLWTTSAGQMPIPIMIGGEEISVTAISGASSPQTFTVTRAQNGVSKAHDAGAPVRLARRPVAAL